MLDGIFEVSLPKSIKKFFPRWRSRREAEEEIKTKPETVKREKCFRKVNSIMELILWLRPNGNLIMEITSSRKKSFF